MIQNRYCIEEKIKELSERRDENNFYGPPISNQNPYLTYAIETLEWVLGEKGFPNLPHIDMRPVSHV